MRVSAVIPLYNKARHIGRAIQSVLRQTHTDFELIVVDDGSTDGSGDRVREHSDFRIRLIRQENAGVSAARNLGVASATASLVAFLDADDEWVPDFLETVLRLRSQFPAARVWGTAYAMQQSAGPFTPVRSVNTEVPCLINFWAVSASAQPIHPSSMMVDKGALESAGGFHQTLIRLEDTDMLIRMALRYPIAYWPDVKAIYHMDSDNRTDGYVYTGCYPFFETARSYLRECGKAASLPGEAEHYLALMHTRALRPNWLAGNRAAMREIIHDCRGVRGFKLVCLRWQVASLVPHRLVKAGWAARAMVARCLGRRGQMQPVRSIYRAANCSGGRNGALR
jgi:glycosyltransferase involved in cell wall biosynthesis